MRTIFQQSIRTGIALSALALAIGTASAAPATTDLAAAVARPGNSAEPTPAASAAALTRAQAKFAHAMQVVNQVQPLADAQGVKTDNWRAEMIGNLMKGSEDQFAVVTQSHSLNDAAISAMQIGNAPASSASAVDPKALGSATYDLVYVPITPCRVLDTRAGGAAIAAGTVSTYTLFAGTNVGAASCGVSAQIPNFNAGKVAAFATNVTVDETGLTGFVAGAYLQIYPQGGSTSTSFMNFGPNQIVANAGVVSVNPTTNGLFSIVTSAPAQTIVDVYGVFIQPAATPLTCSLVVASQALAKDFNGFFFTSAACPASTTPVSAYCYTGNQTGVYSSGSGVNGSGFCSWINLSGAAVTVTQGQTCCQIPGR